MQICLYVDAPLISLVSVWENEMGCRSVWMAVMVCINESLQEQRKLSSFLASAPQQTGSVGADSQPPSLSNMVDRQQFPYFVTQAFNAVSNNYIKINKDNSHQ